MIRDALVLRFNDVSYSYGPSGHAVKALSGVSLSVAPGELVGVLGANGSGKSTLVRLANGMLLPEVGAVEVDGLRTSDELHIGELRQGVGVVFQHPDDQIVATTVEDDVAFGPENLGLDRAHLRVRVDEALAAVGLVGLERREPHLLSGGQKQRLVIAGAIAMQPSYLVLDEPTSMLDPKGRADVLAVIARLRATGRGILHVTHDLAEIADADSVLVLQRGEIAFSGTPQELFGRPELLESCGLAMPPIIVLAQRLRELGVPVATRIADPAGLVEALWG